MAVSQQEVGFFFPWHFFILYWLLVEVQLKSHVNRIDLLGFFSPFLMKGNAQESSHRLAGAQLFSAAQQGWVSACTAPHSHRAVLPETWSCFQPALKML